MPEQITPRVSVVIASHRGDLIGGCVERCIETILRPSPPMAEVIVVADYPIEGCRESYPALRWMYCADISIPKKRNAGIALSGGNIIGFIDDDCMPMENWVAHAIRYLEDNPDKAGVAGTTMVERREGISYPLTEFKRLETPSFRTNNIFYRREAIVKAGGFDERFCLQREDADLAFSILETGLAIGFSAEVRVIHRCRENERWDLLKNCVNRRFDPLLYKKHAPLYRKWIRTPFTPSIGLVSAACCFPAAGLWLGAPFSAVCAMLAVVCALAMGIKRNRLAKVSAVQILRDWLSYMAAPFVLTAALLYGSIKYRKFLLF
jgi:glycosyltransferase involved in cell wall biosynthesis